MKGKLRVKGEKWVTRPRGGRGRVKKNFGEKDFEQTRMKMIGATVE